jgi:endonuclease III
MEDACRFVAAGNRRVMTDLADRRRLARQLLDRFGRGFAEPCGFPAMNNPSSLFQLLVLSLLASSRGDYRKAAALARSLRERGWDSPARMARSPQEQRVQVIRDAGRRDADALATTLGDLAQAVLDRYRGDLRRLRREASRDPSRERQLLTDLPGVSDRVVDLFVREVQVLWPELVPFADRRALAAARRLGLARSTAELAEVAGSDESERLAWLAGVLARVDLENKYDEVSTG